MQSFFNTARTFTVRYAGLSFYWAWVFLSFNSSDLTVQGGAHEILSVVHIVSSIAAMVTFSLAVVFHRKIVEFSCERVGVALIIASLVASAGTLFYTFPGFSGNETLSIVGAIISGLTCSAIVLAWGVVYRGLNAREAVLFTSMTFFGAAVLYFVVSCLASGLSSVVVSLFPVCAAVLAALSLKIPKGNTSQVLESTVSAGWVSDLSQLLSSGLSWRVLLGLAVALFVCGGTRVYFADIAPGVFLDPALMTLPLVFSALVFFVYGIFVSRTSLNLGILYRIAMPLFAFALVLIALLEGDNAGLAFF
ncbi:MAG: LuxR family transcriptional regulator, partial [Raoultibacter sp.]